jgi:hypothetical protein
MALPELLRGALWGSLGRQKGLAAALLIGLAEAV